MINFDEKTQTELADSVMLYGWPRLKELLCLAYRNGYEAGHNDTVDAYYSLDPDGKAEDWLTDAISNGDFNFKGK